MVSIDYSDGTADITFAYDRLGQQAQITDAVGTRTFTYDPDSLQLESESITGLIEETISRSYETDGLAGRYAGVDIGSEYSVAFGYDAKGRLDSITRDVGGNIGTVYYQRYSDSDLMHTVIFDSLLTQTYEYEPHRNLKTKVENTVGTTIISSYDYTYNELGLRDTLNTSGQVFDNFQGCVFPESKTYTANGLNQYGQIVTDDGEQVTETFTYDDDGNMTGRSEGVSYVYNTENRLIEVAPGAPTEGDKRVTFLYDYMGRRARKKVDVFSMGTWQPDKEILFVYDGWNLIKETIAPAEQAARDRYYVWGLDLSDSLQGAGGVGGLLATVDNSKAYYYCYDANGNVGQLIDSYDGTVAAHYQYYPFGKLRQAEGVYWEENSYRFSTKYFDDEVNLYYYGYRYYSPDLGRWINRDPIEENGWRARGSRAFWLISESYKRQLNPLYLFAYNNSINFFDVLGLKNCDPKPGYINKTNGCGPKPISVKTWLLNRIIVWDKYITLNFTPACDAHDTCWGNCCADRRQCDSQFHNNLKKQCDIWLDKQYAPGSLNYSVGITKGSRGYDMDKKLCYKLAELYYSKVSSGNIADRAFVDAQLEACKCPPDRLCKEYSHVMD
jgi:RHS repeat-associated protein